MTECNICRSRILKKEVYIQQSKIQYFMVGVGDPITLMYSDPLITFMKVIVTFYPLLWI